MFIISESVIRIYNDCQGPRIYEHLGRNPGIIYWQIRQPVTINMCTVHHIGSAVVLLSLKCEAQIYRIFSLQLLFSLPSQVVTPPTSTVHVASSSTTWRTGYCRPSSFSLLSSWFSSPMFCSKRSTTTTPRHCDVLVRNPWCVHCTAAWWGTQKPPCSTASSVFAGPVLVFSSGASSAAGPFFLFSYSFHSRKPVALHLEAGALHPPGICGPF